MTTYLLDTDTCVNYLRNRSSRIAHRLQMTPRAEVRLCSIVVAELYYGAYKSPPLFQTINLSLLATFCPQFLSLPFDEAAATVCGRLRADLEARGLPVGPNDVQIASIALVHNLTVVTHNTKHFSRVPGLATEDWHGP